jgi:hypothetical protein
MIWLRFANMKTKKTRSTRPGASVRHHKLKKQLKQRRQFHQRFLLHPITVFGLLCLGVFIIGMTLKVTASSYQVTARVPAAPLTEGADITSPVDGTRVAAVPITVIGTCPADSYVKLIRNGIFSGVAWCDNGGFSIQTDLSAGENSLVAQDYNITDDAGPASGGIVVNYTPPVPPVVGTTGGTSGGTVPNGSSSNSLPLLISADFSFHAFDLGSKFSWPLQISGGKAPYSVAVDWGDGQTDELKSGQKLVLSHMYKSTGYYPVVVTVRDSSGRSATLQFAALIRTQGAAGFTTKQGTPVSSIGLITRIQQWLWLIWPAYTVTILMAVSFWLGERQELMQLLKRPAPKRRPRHP